MVTLLTLIILFLVPICGPQRGIGCWPPPRGRRPVRGDPGGPVGAGVESWLGRAQAGCALRTSALPVSHKCGQKAGWLCLPRSQNRDLGAPSFIGGGFKKGVRAPAVRRGARRG